MIFNFKKCNKVYLFHFLMCLFIGIFAMVTTPINEITQGLKKIILSGSTLLTDYMHVGGMGATLLNASITTLLMIGLYKINKIKPNGSMIMSLWLILGFSMVGKNFLNIWPTIIGVYIYSKIQKEPFINYILISVLSTSLAPLSIEIFKILKLNIYLTILISTITSIFLGVVLPPIAKFCLKIHQGYNLYNVGFANGLIAIIFISIFKYFGFEFETNFLWSTSYTTQVKILLSILFLILIILGIKRGELSKLFKIFKHSGRTLSDYYLIYDDICFINMGLLGFLSLLYVILINGDLNGAVVALILCITGFGAVGKHILNVIPVAFGVIITAFIKNIPLNTPTILLTTLGSTALAPIAGQFGILIGIAAGFLHITLSTNIGHLSGGLNLYNNGFIAGVVAMILLPIIDGFKKGDM